EVFETRARLSAENRAMISRLRLAVNGRSSLGFLPDHLIGFEFDKFERAGADRPRAHVARRDMAGLDRRPAGRQQSQKGWLRLLQMEGELVVAVNSHLVEVSVPGLARIEA